MEKLQTVHKIMVAASAQMQNTAIENKSLPIVTVGDKSAEVQDQGEGSARSSDSWRYWRAHEWKLSARDNQPHQSRPERVLGKHLSG